MDTIKSAQNSQARNVGFAETTDGLQTATRLDERREAFFAEIKKYVETFRTDDALSQEQWEQLDDARRPLARSNSLLVSVIRWVRLHPSHNIEIPILLLISYMSQMRDGVCWISPRRMGELLGRSETAVRNALRALEEDGFIRCVDRGAGRTNGYYPAIYRGLVDLATSPSWFVDAFSPAPRRAGRPRKNTPHPGVRTIPDEIPHTQGCGPFENGPHPSSKYPAPRGAAESCMESCPITSVGEEERGCGGESPSAPPLTLGELVLIEEPKKRSRRSSLTTIAESGWRPSEADVQFAEEHAGWGRERIFDELKKFKKHNLSRGKRYADWSAAWCSWVLRGRDYDRERLAGRFVPSAAPSKSDLLRAALSSGAKQ